LFATLELLSDFTDKVRLRDQTDRLPAKLVRLPRAAEEVEDENGGVFHELVDRSDGEDVVELEGT